MQLERMTLLNWCQHKVRDVDFGRGMTMIVGPNGSGKSNLMGAVGWLLTGENPNSGVKGDNVCQMAGDAERSNGMLLFNHLGQRYEIVRHLKPVRQRATLKIDGVMVCEGDENVTNEVMSRLNLDAKMVTRFLIVAQADIYGFLDAKASEVDKFFQRLFDTAAAPTCVKHITNHVVSVVIPDHLGVPEALERITLNDTNTASVQQQLASLQLPDPSTTTQADCEIINAVNRKVQKQNARLPLVTNVTNQQAAVEQKRSELAAQEENLRVLQQALQNDQPQVDNARAALASWETYKGIIQQREQNTQALNNLQASARTAPVKPADYVPPEQRPPLDAEVQTLQQSNWNDDQFIKGYSAALLQACLNEPSLHPPLTPPENYIPPDVRIQVGDDNARLSYKIRQDEQFLLDFDATGKAECPTCHTPAATLALVVAQTKAELPGRKQKYELVANALSLSQQYDTAVTNHNQWATDHANRLAKLQQQSAIASGLQAKKDRVTSLTNQLTASAQYDLNLNNYNTWYQGYQSQLTQLQQQQQHLANLPATPTQSEADLQAVVAGQEEYRKAINDLGPVITQLRKDFTDATVLLNTYQTQLNTIDAEIAAITATQADADAAQSRINLRQTFESTKSKLEGDLRALQAERPHLDFVYNTLRERAHEAQIKQAWITRMENAKALLAAAPRFVAQHNLQLLERGTNEILDILDAGFHIQADEGLSFTARFRNNVVSPATRLSGGQKVSLALSFRIAVNAMFASTVGLLALDEPTAYLDKQRVRALAPVLQRLQSLTASRGLQCIIVTHEEELSSLFESVIAL